MPKDQEQPPGGAIAAARELSDIREYVKGNAAMLKDQATSLLSIAKYTERTATASVRLADIADERLRSDQAREAASERQADRELEAAAAASEAKLDRQDAYRTRWVDWWSQNGSRTLLGLALLLIFLFGDEASKAMLAGYLPVQHPPDPIVVQVPVRALAPVAPVVAPSPGPPPVLDGDP